MANNEKNYPASEPLWLVLPFLGIFNWIAYYYIGTRANCKTWIKMGHVYMVLFVCFFFAPLIPVINVIYILAMFIGYIVGIIYGLGVFQTYLTRLNLMYHIKKSNVEIENIDTLDNSKLYQFLTEHIPKKDNTPEDTTTSTNNTTSEVKIKNKNKNDDKKIPKIDINNADENILSDLPGFNIILAKKVISERKIRNGFKNIDELEEVLHLQPHLTEQLKKNIKFGDMEKKNPETSNERIIDL